MDNLFYSFTRNINRINSSFMGFIDMNICKNFMDLNPNQVLLIKNIGEESMFVNLASVTGYKTGTNITYNINDLQRKGYIDKTKGKEDERKVYLTLTKKGLNVLAMIDSVLLSHSNLLQEVRIYDKHMKEINKILCKLQKTFEI